MVLLSHPQVTELSECSVLGGREIRELCCGQISLRICQSCVPCQLLPALPHCACLSQSDCLTVSLCLSHCACLNLPVSLCLSHCASLTMPLSLCLSHCAFLTVPFSRCLSHGAFLAVPFSLCLPHCASLTVLLSLCSLAVSRCLSLCLSHCVTLTVSASLCLFLDLENKFLGAAAAKGALRRKQVLETAERILR